jgi:hypothetical protein
LAAVWRTRANIVTGPKADGAARDRADIRGHDLRRTASLMASGGVPRFVISRILNHSAEEDITSVYDRYGVGRPAMAAHETDEPFFLQTVRLQEYIGRRVVPDREGERRVGDERLVQAAQIHRDGRTVDGLVDRRLRVVLGSAVRTITSVAPKMPIGFLVRA